MITFFFFPYYNKKGLLLCLCEQPLIASLLNATIWTNVSINLAWKGPHLPIYHTASAVFALNRTICVFHTFWVNTIEALKQRFLGETKNFLHSIELLFRQSTWCYRYLIVLKAQSALSVTEVRNKWLSSITDFWMSFAQTTNMNLNGWR